MFNLNFSSTAVCDSQVQMISFRNTSNEEVVIEGAAISGGTDPLGNFSLESAVVGSTEQESNNGILQDVHVPAGQKYSFKIVYAPKAKTSEESHRAILDIAYKAPQEGIVQVTLEGNSPSISTNCPSQDEGGPVNFDGNVLMTVDLMIAATSSIGVPLDTNQGVEEFIPVDIPIVLDKDAGTATIPAFTGSDFVMPPPRDDVPIIGPLIRGSTTVTIPATATGQYDASTGELEIPGVQIHMDGELDFAADMEMTLTTGRLSVLTTKARINQTALLQFGDPLHFDSGTNEIFGSPIDSESGEVLLVGITDIKRESVIVRGAPSLSGLRSASIAVLIKGTIKSAP